MRAKDLGQHRPWRVSAAMIVVAMLAFAVACGGDDDTPTPTTDTSGVAPTPTATSPVLAAWEVDWNRTLAAASDEGLVLIQANREPDRNAFEQLQETYPDITVEVLVARGIEERLIREFAAGIHSLDITTSVSGAMETLLPRGDIIGDLRAQLVRPDVVDDANWLGTLDDHWVDDDTKRFVFSYLATPGGANTFVNRDLVSEADLSEHDDILKPEFKGKWCIQDPRERGEGEGWVAQMLVTKGEDFVRRVFRESEPVLFSNESRKLFGDDMIRGEYLFCVGPDIQEAQFIGLGQEIKVYQFPVGDLHPDVGTVRSTCCGTGTGKTEIDGFYGGGFRGPALINGPNPNAAKVFVNWLLGESAQNLWLEQYNYNYCSSRAGLRESCTIGTQDEQLQDGKSYLNTGFASTGHIEAQSATIVEDIFGGR